MKALVTGATGFAGSHLTRYLLTRGYQVRVLMRATSNPAMIAGLPVETALGDLAGDAPLDTTLQGIEVVYHIGAVYRAENLPKRAFWDVNVGGTRKLLEAAKRAGVKRFVHCSTVGVQGDIKNPPAREDAPYGPGDHYQESKRDGEVLALEFGRHEGVPVSVVRPTGIYGPGDTRFLKLFRTINNGTFRMIGTGNVLYHLTYVEDLAAGLTLAGECPAAVGEVFTIGGEGYLTLNELIGKVAAVLGKRVPRMSIPVWPVWLAGLGCELLCRPFGISPPIYRRRVDFFTKSRAFDITKARSVLGYQPRVSLDEGLARTAAWYREQGLLT